MYSTWGRGYRLYLADPTPTAAPLGSGRGRPPRRARPLGMALALPQVAAQLPAIAWQQISYRPGQKGSLVREAVLVPVWRWENGAQAAQALHLLISRELDGTQVKYSLCYRPPAAPALGVGQALYRQMQRYWIERVFQEAKQQLGLHQNQTRSWPAWQHHVALTMMALHLLLDQHQYAALAKRFAGMSAFDNAQAESSSGRGSETAGVGARSDVACFRATVADAQHERSKLILTTTYHKRGHSALAYQSPQAYLQQLKNTTLFSLA